MKLMRYILFLYFISQTIFILTQSKDEIREKYDENIIPQEEENIEMEACDWEKASECSLINKPVCAFSADRPPATVINYCQACYHYGYEYYRNGEC